MSIIGSRGLTAEVGMGSGVAPGKSCHRPKNFGYKIFSTFLGREYAPQKGRTEAAGLAPRGPPYNPSFCMKRRRNVPLAGDEPPGGSSDVFFRSRGPACLRARFYSADVRVAGSGTAEIRGQASRAISTGQLSILRYLHLRPINVVVFHGPSGVLRPGMSSFGDGFPLRCFQRLSDRT